jgi:hypothetical protein
MILFEGYGLWFKSYKVSKEDRFVTFIAKKDMIYDMDDIVDIEDYYDITFVHENHGGFVFRINYEH